MEQIIEFVTANIEIAPYIIGGVLLLAGFNLPISEDGMLFISAILAVKNPEMTYSLFIGVFLGAYFSDLIAYSLGRFLGPQLFKIKWFASMVTQKRLDQMSSYYERYGIITLILGRFIPFGVRNALFISAGLSKMRFSKFSLSDLLACVISCTTYFLIYLKFGEMAIDAIKKSNYVIFTAAILVVAFLIFKKRKAKKARSAEPVDPG